eukprot:scaffold328608_cov36-Prasinocladus_malaysianus.AAC.1
MPLFKLINSFGIIINSKEKDIATFGGPKEGCPSPSNEPTSSSSSTSEEEQASQQGDQAERNGSSQTKGNLPPELDT